MIGNTKFKYFNVKYELHGKKLALVIKMSDIRHVPLRLKNTASKSLLLHFAKSERSS